MAWWKFKSCPRCGGDLFIDKDMYGRFEQCIQCGYTHDLKSPSTSGQQEAGVGKEEDRGVTALSKR